MRFPLTSGVRIVSNQKKPKNIALGNRIRAVRALVPGRTAEQLSDLIGVRRGSVANWESGTTGIRDDNLAKLAEVCGVSLEWLMTGHGGLTAINESVKYRDTRLGDLPILARNQTMGGSGLPLPVYATQDEGSGVMLAIKEVAEWMPRPFRLEGREDGYGLKVSNNKMSPVFRYGDTVWFDPLLSPTSDCEVAIYTTDEDGVERHILCTLVDFNSSEWIVQTMQPEVKRFSLPRETWPKCHRCVHKQDRL